MEKNGRITARLVEPSNLLVLCGFLFRENAENNKYYTSRYANDNIGYHQCQVLTACHPLIFCIRCRIGIMEQFRKYYAIAPYEYMNNQQIE